MKSILIVGCDSLDARKKYYEDYRAFFQSAIQGVQVYVADIEQLYIQCGDGEIVITDVANDSRPLSKYAIVIWRGAGLSARLDVLKALSCYCHEYGVELINDITRGHHQSKLAQAVFCYENKLSVPTTVYVNKAINELSGELSLRFPLVLKAVNGAHGNDNHIVYNMNEVNMITQNSYKRYVLQRLIPNEGDYRVLIVGDEIMVIARKATNGSHLNNTSQGGQASLVDASILPDGLINDAIRFAHLLNMRIAGVDAIVDKVTGEYYFLEINSQPQLMTGSFLDEKKALVGRLLRDIGN